MQEKISRKFKKIQKPEYGTQLKLGDGSRKAENPEISGWVFVLFAPQ